MQKYFSRVRSAQDLIISLTFIILGVLLIAFPFNDMSGTAGCIMILIGIATFFVLKSVYKDMNNGGSFRKKTVYFPASMKGEIINAMEKDGFNGLDKPDEGVASQSLMLSVFYDNRSDKAFLQLFEYVPYSYKSCTDFYETRWDGVKHLVE